MIVSIHVLLTFLILTGLVQSLEESIFLASKFDNTNYTVTLLVFSGTEDPEWTIDSNTFNILQKLIHNKKYQLKKSTVMGYKGFTITPIGANENISTLIKGNPQAEIFLLESIKERLPEQVYDHILEQIIDGYELISPIEINLQLSTLEKYRSHNTNHNYNFNYNFDCNVTPIRGSDVIPNFNPTTDDFGCFKEMQYKNNCYNYGNDIVTNTFAQPGRGTEHKWEENTCEDVKRAAISDGLKWVGTDYPTEKPSEGHYLALLIWPETNFHWVRLDSNGMWSHKPGGTAIQNKDNDGNLIHDPSTQNFSPWTQFCGYFLTTPSKVNIN